MKVWQKKNQEQIKQHIFEALRSNINFESQNILGIPASYLDEDVFSQDETFLKEAPFMTAMVKNPNHIGCHTLGESEKYFSGTHAIERELIELCAVDILKGQPLAYDGYIASGGTEANIQAMWIYRNYFVKEFNANPDEICILCTEDSHYSFDKASNLLCLDIIKVRVDDATRILLEKDLCNKIQTAKTNGKSYFIVVCNLMTTMFGSVDDIELYVKCLKKYNIQFKIHVDGAFGGFYYPILNENHAMDFQNEYISSYTMDAHKMAQAPYGTGIFIVKKGLMGYVHTQEASYVSGQDYTLIGSRSGANAVAVWMILMKHGPHGWFEKMYILQKRALWLCQQLDNLDISYYCSPGSNIITIRAEHLNSLTVNNFGLVPDNHVKANWYKLVVMPHVRMEHLQSLVNDLKEGHRTTMA